MSLSLIAIWSTLEDEIEKSNEQLRRLKNFRDLE